MRSSNPEKWKFKGPYQNHHASVSICPCGGSESCLRLLKKGSGSHFTDGAEQICFPEMEWVFGGREASQQVRQARSRQERLTGENAQIEERLRGCMKDERHETERKLSKPQNSNTNTVPRTYTYTRCIPTIQYIASNCNCINGIYQRNRMQSIPRWSSGWVLPCPPVRHGFDSQ